MVLVVMRKNFRWAETTILTCAAVYWGLQLCRQQCEGMGWGMNFHHVSSSRVAGAVSVCLASEICFSKREACAVRLLIDLWDESHKGSHAEVFDTPGLTWNNWCARLIGSGHLNVKSETDKHYQWRRGFPFGQIVSLATDNVRNYVHRI